MYRSDSSRGRRQLFFQEGRMDDGEDANSAQFKHQIENISGSGGWLQRTIGALRAKVKHVGRQNFRSRRELIILLHVRGKPWSAMKKRKKKACQTSINTHPASTPEGRPPTGSRSSKKWQVDMNQPKLTNTNSPHLSIQQDSQKGVLPPSLRMVREDQKNKYSL